MNRFTAFVLFAVIALVVATSDFAVAAPVPKEKPKEKEKTDKEKLQGKWKVDAMQVGGMNMLANLGVNLEMVYEFKGDSLDMSVNALGQNKTSTATIKHDADGMKRFTTVDANARNATGAGYSYSLDGDKLLLAMDSAGKPINPLMPGPKDMILVLSRVK